MSILSFNVGLEPLRPGGFTLRLVKASSLPFAMECKHCSLMVIEWKTFSYSSALSLLAAA